MRYTNEGPFELPVNGSERERERGRKREGKREKQVKSPTNVTRFVTDERTDTGASALVD